MTSFTVQLLEIGSGLTGFKKLGSTSVSVSGSPSVSGSVSVSVSGSTTRVESICNAACAEPLISAS